MSKQKYVVTKKGVNRGLGDKKIEHKIGDDLELTEDQAAGLVGKIRLKGEATEPSKSVKDLKAENAKLAKLNGEMDAAGVDLTAKLAEAQKQLGDQAAQINDLTAKLAEATKAK